MSTPSPREQMTLGAAQLLSRAGLAEASFRNVVALTGAPRGSIYHHFPGGKDEMVAEAMRTVGVRVVGALQRAEVEAPVDVLAVLAGLFRRVLVDSACDAGCAVAAVAGSDAAGPLASQAATEVFTSWVSALTACFESAGVDPARSAGLATLTLATVEGALVTARAAGEVAPYDLAVDELSRLLGGAADARATSGRED
ncbi:TetR/AcrR family transcriptional regulator [Nocardioides rubriscoriae]|uniref:TetR/AcrR family transcriptional regulator n=1 Tax=Nocardioides rubriscoriae TaxID=642762 RepID=UPI0014781542|nr:TetR/AcrR family transcriptional regulator [Nocardioides rubriscoriae]